MKRYRQSLRPLGLICSLLLGCGDLLQVPGEGGGEGSGTDGGGSREFQYDAEAGTCDGWKVRFCEAFVHCGHGTLDECVHTAEFVECHSDSPFQECEKQFEKVIKEKDCALFPTGCYPRDIADRTAALTLCQDVQEAACEYDFFCGFSFNLETCITETSHLYQCSRRLSAVPGAEACVTDLNRAGCGDSLPEVCADHTRF
jgi:hypothetical protein